MNAHIPNMLGTIDFRVEGQPAIPKWQQTAIADALKRNDSPPKALRFQCRIATDARVMFEKVRLVDGETLTLHRKAKPQFGKDRSGNAFLTTTLVYSGDGKAYSVKWVGSAVPDRMQSVAVKHDLGKAVRPAVIPLDLADATVVPAHIANGYATTQTNPREVQARADRKYQAKRKANGGKPVTKYTFGRLTADDLDVA